MTLLNIVRSLDDQRFIWRVKGAVIQTAVAKLEDADQQHAAYARAVLANPLGDAGKAPAIVAANPVIAAAITVDAYDTVSTEGVNDNDILFIVGDNWDILSEEYKPVEASAQ